MRRKIPNDRKRSRLLFEQTYRGSAFRRGSFGTNAAIDRASEAGTALPSPERRRLAAGLGAGAIASLLPVTTLAAVPARDALAAATAKKTELLELLDALIRVRSLSGETAEDAQRIVKAYLGNLSYDIEESADRPSDYVDHAEYMPPNPPGDGPFVNVVGTPRGGSRHALFAHIDTHVLADGWNTDPFVPELRGNRLYGLGTSDDKGGIAAMLVAATILDDLGGPLPIVMSLHGKGGGSRGSLPVFERFRRSGRDVDAVLYVHPAETGRGLADIKNEVLGVVDLELSVEGWRAPPMEIGSIDSAAWHEGGNALDVCIEAFEDLRSTVFQSMALNLGNLRGGDRIGSVAETAVAQFRVKFTGNDTWLGLLEAARARLNRFSERLTHEHGSYALSLSPVAYRTNPGAAAWNIGESRVLRDAIESVTGRAPDAYPNHYAGDIRYPIRLLDVPAYGIGSIGGNFYGPNEWVDVDDLLKLAAVVVSTVAGWSEL